MNVKRNYDELRKIDSQDMFTILKEFPAQVREAVEIGRNAPSFTEKAVSDEYIIAGMGGSAIGGDTLRSYASSLPGANHLKITVNRTYSLPKSIDRNTNVILSSYSGGTEETLSAANEALSVTRRLVCITTGGKLGETADKNGFPKITIPGGMQPRCALGYSFFPMLYVFLNCGAFAGRAEAITEKSLEELIPLLQKRSEQYSDWKNENNHALKLAEDIYGTAPVVYSASERMDTVNLRWRGQFHENAKNFAFGGFLPEMNHNEVNSWAYPSELKQKFSIILLRDPDDHPRVKIRFDALETLLKKRCGKMLVFESSADTLLARIFDMIYLGDWASWYLALLNGVDPTPIPFISELKNILSGK